MKKLIYPGVFHKEDNVYWMEFPDLEGCQSFGDTLEEIHENAKEALAAYLVTLLEQGREIAPPTDIFDIEAPQGAFISLVDADLVKKSQAVKKTLTIPSWLNEMAESANINFSQTLQRALMNELKIAN